MRGHRRAGFASEGLDYFVSRGKRQLNAGVILPVAKSLYLCDGHLGFMSGKVDRVIVKSCG